MLERAQRRRRVAVAAREAARAVAPAPPPDAGDGNLHLRARRYADGRVDDPVLLGPHELLAVEYEHVAVCVVPDEQVGDAPALGDFRHLDEAALQRLLEFEIWELRLFAYEDRGDFETTELHRLARV